MTVITPPILQNPGGKIKPADIHSAVQRLSSAPFPPATLQLDSRFHRDLPSFPMSRGKTDSSLSSPFFRPKIKPYPNQSHQRYFHPSKTQT
jgi:hypothetical protein